MNKRTDANDIELETSFQEFLLDLLGDTIETNVASWEDGVPLRHCHSHDGTVLIGKNRETGFV